MGAIEKSRATTKVTKRETRGRRREAVIVSSGVLVSFRMEQGNHSKIV